MSEVQKRRKMLEVIFDQGLVGFVMVDVASLYEEENHLGFPSQLFSDPRFQVNLPLRFDPESHGAMDVDFQEDAVVLSLSFDRIYRCKIPYAYFTHIGCTLEAAEWKQEEGPQLRLVYG